MLWKNIGLTGLLVGIGLSAAGCTDGYGYSGVNVGVGNAGYYDPYNGSYAGYGGYGGGYGYVPGYFGWSNGYYYPGTGTYVYDRDRRRYRWNDGQRRYWEGRRGIVGGNARIRDNWAGFRGDARQGQRDVRGNRQAYRDGSVNRERFQPGRRDARQDRRAYGGSRQEYRVERQANPGAGRAFRGAGGGGRSSGGRGGIPRPQQQ